MLSHFKASFFNSTKLLLVAQQHYKFNALYPSKVKANLKTRCPKRTISDYRNDIPNNEQKSTDQNCTQSEVYKDDGLLELSEAVIENEDTDFQDNTLEPTENSNTLAAKIYNTSWYQALIARSKSQLENNQRIKIIIEDSELKEKFTRGSGNGGQKPEVTNAKVQSVAGTYFLLVLFASGFFNSLGVIAESRTIEVPKAKSNPLTFAFLISIADRPYTAPKIEPAINDATDLPFTYPTSPPVNRIPDIDIAMCSAILFFFVLSFCFFKFIIYSWQKKKRIFGKP
ncbi:hypothetical protein AX774_g6532 [Zancudomyces culisetae]|uniref:Uncharacterized protein n=1 Tax=Zancudomyces culisetae TaxID=1213189 RepID=A0A1R1PGC1_ZANCU|nr:hypothetical protein AX774_g6532 [Zancudomyces culisetae]|eukprot:OMH80030.1 hypothetical protein AX774_g6532 [Zancudomyces culisetae]